MQVPNARQPFIDAWRAEAKAFGRPVLLVHGSSHRYQLNQPFADGEQGVSNVTRVETFGTPNAHWVKVRVDPADPRLFRVDPILVPENAYVPPGGQ